jgi:histidinol dehydrogenase
LALRIDFHQPDFEDRFTDLLAMKREASQDVGAAVAQIIADVRARGDSALVELSARYDGVDLQSTGLRVGADEINAACEAVDPAVLDALQMAAERIERHHARQMPKDDIYTDGLGVTLGSRWSAIEAVGLYVPGGKASYPSSVLMNALPAKVAGVERIVMVVPARDGVINPAVLAAARIAGVSEIYRIGGAQAVAALAYGTETIAPVYKIVGPGNAYVAGQVGIDMIAGPSEVLVVADGSNDPDWIAADLLAQAEHDEAAQSILITDDAELAEAVEGAVMRQLKTLSNAQRAEASWRDFGAVITVPDLMTAVPYINRIAAEHLELALDEPDAMLASIRNAGAIFVGRHTPEVIGDYNGGSNHVLPTARSARFSSGLSVLDYVKRTSILRLGPDQLRALGPAAITLAEAEGLDAHARSVSIRMNDPHPRRGR